MVLLKCASMGLVLLRGILLLVMAMVLLITLPGTLSIIFSSPYVFRDSVSLTSMSSSSPISRDESSSISSTLTRSLMVNAPAASLSF